MFCGGGGVVAVGMGVGGGLGTGMVLDKLPVPGCPTHQKIIGQEPTAFTVDAVGGCLDIFSLFCHFFILSPFHWETARYGLKYCLKGPFSPKLRTNCQQCSGLGSFIF